MVPNIPPVLAIERKGNFVDGGTSLSLTGRRRGKMNYQSINWKVCV